MRYNQELFFYPNIQNIFHQAKMIVQRVYSAMVLFCVLGNYQIWYPNTIQSVFEAFVLILDDLVPIYSQIQPFDTLQ